MPSLTPVQYYHAYNEGASGGLVFVDGSDYERFLALLYIANNTDSFLVRDQKPGDIFNLKRSDYLVEIIAYCLMPNRFHIAFRERRRGDGGRFIQKLCTAYAMYYNRRHDHSGTLFQGTYQARPIGSDGGLRQLIQEIHLDPFSGVDRKRKTRIKSNLHKAIEYASRYPYSSMQDYLGVERLERAILSFGLNEEA